MTEDEWVACTEPGPMLEFMQGKASDRQLRLFACACCRRIGHLILDERAWQALQVAEQFADRQVGDEERTAARKLVQQAAQSQAVTRTTTIPTWQRRAISTVYYANARDAMEAVYHAPKLAILALVHRVADLSECVRKSILRDEQSHQASLFRDILGSPFRSTLVTPSILTPGVLGLALSAYEEANFDHLPILADALEDAGCTNEIILGHCRQPGSHFRGCWVVDAILNKQ